jgi:hypothetical protein
MTKNFALCPGAGLDYCANCQRNADNQPEASKDPHQAWIPETSNDHCAYFREEPSR